MIQQYSYLLHNEWEGPQMMSLCRLWKKSCSVFFSNTKFLNFSTFYSGTIIDSEEVSKTMQRRTMYPSPSSLLSHKIYAHHYNRNLKPGNWHWCNWQTLFCARFTHICVCVCSPIALSHITRATMTTKKMLNSSIISKTSLLLSSFLVLSSSYTLKNHPQRPAHLRQCVLDQTDTQAGWILQAGLGAGITQVSVF